MDVSENSGTPKSSISIFNHPFWGTRNFWKPPYIIYAYIHISSKLVLQLQCFFRICFKQHFPRYPQKTARHSDSKYGLNIPIAKNRIVMGYQLNVIELPLVFQIPKNPLFEVLFGSVVVLCRGGRANTHYGCHGTKR